MGLEKQINDLSNFAQLFSHLLKFKKVLYTDGLEWRFYDIDKNEKNLEPFYFNKEDYKLDPKQKKLPSAEQGKLKEAFQKDKEKKRKEAEERSKELKSKLVWTVELGTFNGKKRKFDDKFAWNDVKDWERLLTELNKINWEAKNDKKIKAKA